MLAVPALEDEVHPFLAIVLIEIRHLIEPCLEVHAGISQSGQHHLPILFPLHGIVANRLKRSVHIPFGLAKIILLVGCHTTGQCFRYVII